jgi:hypothetical protein
MEPKQKRLTEGQRRKLTRDKQENMLFGCMCFWICIILICTLIELHRPKRKMRIIYNIL